MAGVQANWHLADLVIPDGADAASEIEELKLGAVVIDLTTSEAELSAQFQELLVLEGRYADFATADDGTLGVGCELKWSPEHRLVSETGTRSCFNCPSFVANQAMAASRVCAVGRKQEVVIEHIRGLKLAATLDQELCMAFELEIEESAALAEACLA